MIILKERVAGYNNVLRLATSDMKFGINEDINYVEPVLQTTTTQGPLDVTPKTNNETVYLLGSAVTLGFLVARYII